MAKGRARAWLPAMRGARTQHAPPSSAKTGTTQNTSFQVVARACWMRASSFAPMARARLEVSPVERPTHTAIIASSKGSVSPMAATAASPMVPA
jgi:hypothetical protein